jgi:hypothetical protein
MHSTTCAMHNLHTLLTDDLLTHELLTLWFVNVGPLVLSMNSLEVPVLFLTLIDLEKPRDQVKSSTFIVTTFSTAVLGTSLSIPFSLLVFLSLFGSFLGMGLVSC